MGIEYGRNAFTQTTGSPVQVTYDGKPRWKPGSSTIAWSKVAAVGSDTLIAAEQFTVPSGQKFLRYGQVMTMITSAGAFTLTVTGTPTGGNLTLTIYDPVDYGTKLVTVPYNSSVAAVQTLVDAAIGAGRLTVSGAGVLPGNVHTFTQVGNLLGMTMVTPAGSAAGLTGGTSPAVAVATTVAGNLYGQFGPYDSGASDGRQTLTRGNVGILNETILENGPLALPTSQSTNHPGLIVGGNLWKERLLVTSGSASLAAGPTFATLEAVMPLISYPSAL